MSKAIIVPDLAYTSRTGRRGGKSNGYKELKAKLKYFTYRDDANGHIPQEQGLERWHDRGLGQHYHDILRTCDTLATDKVLAWTWVISPAPDLMALVPEVEREELVVSLTERVVEAYYDARSVEVPEFSFVMHDRLTKADEESGEGLQQLHTHIILPGTVPNAEGGHEPFFNRSNKGHVQLLRDISTLQFEAALDQHIGTDWRKLRQEPEIAPEPALPDTFAKDEEVSELERWFGPRGRDISGL